jgi:hypothetical protein
MGNECSPRAHEGRGDDTSPLSPHGDWPSEWSPWRRDTSHSRPAPGEGPPAAAPRASGAEIPPGPTGPDSRVRSGEARASRRGKAPRRRRRALVERSEDRQARCPAREGRPLLVPKVQNSTEPQSSSIASSCPPPLSQQSLAEAVAIPRIAGAA